MGGLQNVEVVGVNVENQLYNYENVIHFVSGIQYDRLK